MKFSNKHRNLTRDADQNLLLPSKNLFILIPLLVLGPISFFGMPYFFFGIEFSVGNLHPIILFPVTLCAFSYIGLVFATFTIFKVKKSELERDCALLKGNQLFPLPKWLQKILRIRRALYIKPEQVKFFRKLRTGLIIEGFLYEITFLMLYFFT